MVSAAASMFTTSSGTLPADNSTTVTLTFVARDAYNTPLAGVRPVFTATGTGNTLTTPAATDATGTTTATFKTSVAEAKTVTATVASHTINQSIALTASSANAPDAAHTTIGVAPTSVAVAGTATITVTAKDSSGTAITVGGATVTLSLSGGTATGTIGAVTDNGDGTYTATYTGTGAGTAETINGTINGATITTTLPTITVTGSYQTPDILNGASFESGSWNGYTNGGGGDPDNGVVIDTTQGYAGSASAKYAWTGGNGGDIGCHMFHSMGGSFDRVWGRTYFKLTAHIDSVQKWWRFEDAGLSGGIGGLWLVKDGGSGTGGNGLFCLGWDSEDSGIITTIGLTEAQVIDGNWHCLEFEYQRNGGSTGYPEMAFWFDGNPQYPEYNGHSTVKYWDGSQQKTSWVNGRANAGMRNSSTKLGYWFHMGTLNAGNTTSGQCNLDLISVSSLGRIGP